MNTHPNARLTPVGRVRLVRRHDVTTYVGPVLMRVGGRGHAAAPC
jgi:hypothetical protein